MNLPVDYDEKKRGGGLGLTLSNVIIHSYNRTHSYCLVVYLEHIDKSM